MSLPSQQLSQPGIFKFGPSSDTSSVISSDQYAVNTSMFMPGCGTTTSIYNPQQLSAGQQMSTSNSLFLNSLGHGSVGQVNSSGMFSGHTSTGGGGAMFVHSSASTPQLTSKLKQPR